MAYSAYLDEHIQGHLTTAIAEASIRNPKDAVDFIANFLLKIVEDDALSKKVSYAISIGQQPLFLHHPSHRERKSMQFGIKKTKLWSCNDNRN